MKYYTGVGTRDCPPWAKLIAALVAVEMYDRGFILRSGHARGMDISFEKGHDFHAQGGEVRKRIYLPREGFEGGVSDEYTTSYIHPHAYVIAKRIHPNWKACDEFSRNAHARNCHQVLGDDLNTPSTVLFCYTHEGLAEGGTRTAIILAQEVGIPVFNFGTPGQDITSLVDFVEKYC